MTSLGARGRGLLDGPVLAAFLKIPYPTIRWWASEGLIERKGTGPRGVALYDVGEVARLAVQRGRLTRAS